MIQILALLFGLITSPAFAQNTTCANKPAADNSNACANTRFVTSAITAAYPNTWLKSVAGTSVNATANGFSAANQAMWLVGNLTGTGTGPYSILSINDTAENLTEGAAAAGLWIAHNINTGAKAGNRTSFLPILSKNVALPGTNKNLKFYIPHFSQFYINSGDGGSSGNYMGDHYGGAALVQAQNGATYLETMQGFEVDVSIQTGANARLKNALLLAGVNSDSQHADEWEAFLSFTRDGTSTATWNRAIDLFYPQGQWAFSSASTILGSSQAGGAIGYGVDFSNLSINNSAFKSPGFNVTGTGVATVNGLTSTGNISSTGGSAGFVAVSRTGTGNSYQWYNGTGVDMRLYDGASDLITISSSGISTANNISANNAIISNNTTALHHYSTISAPVASSCGTSPTVDAGSSAHAGKITFGSATTACTLTFASAFDNNAFCTVTPGAQPAAVANIPYISAQSKTAFTISGGTASAVYYYNCGGN
jgi:hypothetical protein